MLEWFNTLGDILGADRYAAHSICLTNDPVIMTVFLAGDVVTSISYFIMGTAFYVYRARIVAMSPEARGLYGAFIVLCGLSHAAKSLTLFVGIYRLEAMVVMAMAAVSAATAAMTWQQIGEWTKRDRGAHGGP